MKNIDSYNSSYPLAFYDIGEIYSFYGNNNTQGKPANEDAINKYSKLLVDMTETTKSALKPISDVSVSNVNTRTFDRFYGVVVGKNPKNNYIEVLFCNLDGDNYTFFTRKYSVNHGCALDGKDILRPKASLSISEEKENAIEKIGGITKAESNNRSGGITRAENENSNSSSIGGITRTAATNKVGGITRANTSASNKVGGITRANSSNNSNAGGITRAANNTGGITRASNSNGNVGGITRANNVGGITRPK